MKPPKESWIYCCILLSVQCRGLEAIDVRNLLHVAGNYSEFIEHNHCSLLPGGLDSSRSMAACNNQSLSQTQLEERKILVRLFEENNGEKWRCKQLWNVKFNHCCWQGINCSDTTGLVEEMLLYDIGMKGTLKAPLLKLTSLRVLVVSHNRLNGRLEDILTPNATSLEKLILASNDFTGNIPWDVLSTYSSLRYLELAYNYNVGGQISERVGNIRNLEVLSLGQTMVSGEVPNAITQLKKLWFLDFEMLKLSGNISFIVELPQLSYVHLKHNKLYGQLSPDFGHRLVHLEDLNLRHNLLGGEFPDSFDSAVKITIIDVANNKFTGQIPSSVLNLQKLEFLDVSFNNFVSISSNISLPSIQFLLLANNSFIMTPQKLFDTLLGMKYYTSLRVLDVSSCALAGEAPELMWDFTELLVLNISRNYLTGRIPPPRVTLYYLLIADLSYNHFNQSIPDELSELRSIRELDVRYNPHLKSHHSQKHLPAFAVVDNASTIRESQVAKFTCPTIRFDNANSGILYVDSAYYNRRYCVCDSDSYGHNGWCRTCIRRGTCKGGETFSKIVIPQNYYPVPSFTNVSSFVECSSFYQDTFRCNPSGTCTCWLSENGTETTCNSNCVCTFNSTGRLCSQCQLNHYRHFDICLPCSENLETTVVAGVAVGVFVILFCIWLLGVILPKYVQTSKIKALQIGGIISQAVIVLSLGLTQIIPTYAAEFYLLIVVLAFIDYFQKLSSMKVFAFILFVHFQVLDLLRVCSYSTDCKYCSFAGLLDYLGIDKITRVVNFHFSGLACSFPFLAKPVGRLLFLVVGPFCLSLLVFLCIFVDHRVRVCCGTVGCNAIDIERTRMETRTRCQATVIFLLNVFYFPVATDTIKALLPCQEEPSEEIRYMKAYPWITCQSHAHTYLVILASLAMVLYVFGVPLLFFVLIRRYHPTPIPKEATLAEAKRSLLHDKAKMAGDSQYGEAKWLRGLCSPFKLRYRYAAVFLMLRRLVLAIILAAIPKSQSDAQSVALSLFLGLVVICVSTMMPYDNVLRWQPESLADVGSFLIILVTYTGMSSRTDVMAPTAAVVFAINVLFVLAVCVVAVGQPLYVFWRQRKGYSRTPEPEDSGARVTTSL